MSWIALFNLAYGSLGLIAALYLGRPEGVALCVWVIALGAVMYAWKPVRSWRRATIRRSRVIARARASA